MHITPQQGGCFARCQFPFSGNFTEELFGYFGVDSGFQFYVRINVYSTLTATIYFNSFSKKFGLS